MGSVQATFFWVVTNSKEIIHSSTVLINVLTSWITSKFPSSKQHETRKFPNIEHMQFSYFINYWQTLQKKKKIKHVSKERIPTVGEKVRGEKGRRKGVKVDRGENRLEREKTNMPTTNYFFFSVHKAEFPNLLTFLIPFKSSPIVYFSMVSNLLLSSSERM